MHEHRIRRRIEFSDTDMGGIVHFARFFVFMEGAEHDFLRSLGVNPGTFVDGDGRHLGWPRVSSTCDYLSPARFGDELEIHLRVLRKGGSSMTYGFEISREETAVARGRVTAAFCHLDAPGGVKAVRIPPEIASLLEEAPSTD